MWVSGFTSGDGSFYTKLTKYKDTFHTGCIFKITLHLKDVAVLEGLFYYFSNYFTAEAISLNKYNSRTNKGIYFSKNSVSLTFSNIKDITPPSPRERAGEWWKNYNSFFWFISSLHSPRRPAVGRGELGVKSLDFKDFKFIYSLIYSKNHLKAGGMSQILRIRKGMNDKRTKFLTEAGLE